MTADGRGHAYSQVQLTFGLCLAQGPRRARAGPAWLTQLRGDRLWYAQVEGLRGRPTGGALGICFRPFEPASVERAP